MKLRRITEAEDAGLAKLIELYTDSFPAEERRQAGALKELIAKQPTMFFNAVECEGALCGLFVYWDFKDFYYLEHLAVFSALRNKKIGQQVLDYINDNLKGIRLLEVEPTADEMTTRRVNYYQRNGYKILDRNYIQPSYDGIHHSIPLWIMGNEEYTAPEKLEQHIRTIKEEVYLKNR